MSIVYLNGEYLPLEQAKIPVEERGFLFGDGIYEVVRLYGGRLFRLEVHMQRWAHSVEGARLPLLDTLQTLPAILERLQVKNNLWNAEVYLQYTRGTAHPRTHAFPEDVHPTLLAMPIEIHPPADKAYEQGIRAITLPDLRWQRCDIKSVMLLPNVMAKQQAREQGAFEAILARDGRVTEGASTNIFCVIGGCLTTHPLIHAILGGVTRGVVLALARELDIAVREEPFSVENLYAAEEVFLTSTTSEVLPITTVDGRPIHGGMPGPVTRRLLEAFRRTTREDK